jgi:hypothetical protein
MVNVSGQVEETYEGMWADGEYHGQGTLKTVDGADSGKRNRSVFTGQWLRNQKHGHGEEIYSKSVPHPAQTPARFAA